MKLVDLGLKVKPSTKYFEHGYVKFYTVNKTLFFEIFQVTKEWSGSISAGSIQDEQHLKDLLAIKSVNEAVNL